MNSDEKMAMTGGVHPFFADKTGGKLQSAKPKPSYHLVRDPHMSKMTALKPPRVGTEAVIEINMGKARNIGTTLQSRKKGWLANIETKPN